MDVSRITSAWRTFFGECPPVGFLCRDSFPERWLRIHSLPGSKRYPENEIEISEILRRHNAVATEILGEQAPIVVFVPQFPGSSDQPEIIELLGASLQIAEIPSLSVSDEEGFCVTIAAADSIWKKGEFDHLIHAVAEDRAKFLFANLEVGTAYAPYDGGADLFFSNSQAVEEARVRWKSWLSAHPEGL